MLADADRERIVAELGRDPTRAEAALFENLWSEHCAYRSSRPLLGAFDSDGPQVVVGPGDDAAVVAVPPGGDGDPAEAETYVTFGIESHNHPSYVDPYDGAATGVGGIVRDTLSMGAYPIALADSLYFGDFAEEHPRYLFEGVVEGIADYGNAIGVPTVGGSLAFHPDYEGNPLVNVACVGLLDADRLVTAAAKEPGNKLVLVGNATGRDGLGGASFASEDLSEDAETEDRPAVQVGDPYTEKLLIEANEALCDRALVVAARDLGAAGLGGATAEMAAQGNCGARIELDRVHQREPNMNATEILLAESQERMCYEVRPDDVDAVRAVAERFDLGSAVIGEVTADRYVCTFAGGETDGSGDPETVVDVPAPFLADGAPMNDLDREPSVAAGRDLPDLDPEALFDDLLADPNTASRRWVYRQYDHEVGLRTAVRPGNDAALLSIHESDAGLALAAGAAPNWTDAAPYEGARAVAVARATDLAAVGAEPLAAVDCLNGGNPEKPDVYGGFADAVDGLADGCRALGAPVVGGNVSLYNDSPSGPIPPTPTLAMIGARAGTHAPIEPVGDRELLLVGDPANTDPDAVGLGGSIALTQAGGTDVFPAPPTDPAPFVESLAAVARDHASAVHAVGRGGLAVALAELATPGVGIDANLAAGVDGRGGALDDAIQLYHERAGRAVVETDDPAAVRDVIAEHAPVERIGRTTTDGRVSIDASEAVIRTDAEAVAERRSVFEALDR
jgi:phosphoribosylformylglycinamidine synthase II